MEPTVNIPFNVRLDPGDTSFTVDLSEVALHHPKLRYGFTTVTLCPDYYSSQAFQLNMDSDKELKEIIKNPFKLDIEFKQNAFGGREWSLTGPTGLSALLKNLNNFFDLNKPEGCLFPPVVFDWIHINSLTPGVDSVEFHKNLAQDFYGEPYDATKHSNALPVGYRDRFKLNNMIFPTVASLIESIRIRITLAPNVTLAFSNAVLPTALGVTETQMPEKTNKQIQFINDKNNSYTRIVCQGIPAFGQQPYSTKIHLYPTFKQVVTDEGYLETTKERERKHDLMALDYNATLQSLASGYNLVFSLQHNAAQKKFKFNYPNNPGININVFVPPYVSHSLGYGHVSVIRPDMTNVPYPEDVDIKDVEKTARVLVYDAGLVVVSLDESSSQKTHQFTNTFMALLEPEFSGVLKTPLLLDLPLVPVSKFRKQLTFVLSRFSEQNQPTPLDWKVGAYIRGMLVGKV
jgi:hypothetical protein